MTTDRELIEALSLALYCRVYNRRDPGHPDLDKWHKELLGIAREHQQAATKHPDGIVISLK